MALGVKAAAMVTQVQSDLASLVAFYPTPLNCDPVQSKMYGLVWVGQILYRPQLVTPAKILCIDAVG